jgi:hypothetical protein
MHDIRGSDPQGPGKVGGNEKIAPASLRDKLCMETCFGETLGEVSAGEKDSAQGDQIRVYLTGKGHQLRRDTTTLAAAEHVHRAKG